MARGTVKTLVRERGFGFIHRQGAVELFFHKSAFHGGGFDSLTKGKRWSSMWNAETRARGCELKVSPPGLSGRGVLDAPGRARALSGSRGLGRMDPVGREKGATWTKSERVFRTRTTRSRRSATRGSGGPRPAGRRRMPEAIGPSWAGLEEQVGSENRAEAFCDCRKAG